MKHKTTLDLKDGYEIIIESKIERANAQILINQDGRCYGILCIYCSFKTTGINDYSCENVSTKGAKMRVKILKQMGYRKK